VARRGKTANEIESFADAKHAAEVRQEKGPFHGLTFSHCRIALNFSDANK
jgi:hypothetical protein